MKIISKTSELVSEKILNKIFDEVYFEQPHGHLMTVQTKIKDIVWIDIYDIMGSNAYNLIINGVRI